MNYLEKTYYTKPNDLDNLNHHCSLGDALPGIPLTSPGELDSTEREYFTFTAQIPKNKIFAA